MHFVTTDLIRWKEKKHEETSTVGAARIVDIEVRPIRF